jgi:hypothetical protein
LEEFHLQPLIAIGSADRSEFYLLAGVNFSVIKADKKIKMHVSQIPASYRIHELSHDEIQNLIPTALILSSSIWIEEKELYPKFTEISLSSGYARGDEHSILSEFISTKIYSYNYCETSLREKTRRVKYSSLPIQLRAPNNARTTSTLQELNLPVCDNGLFSSTSI